MASCTPWFNPVIFCTGWSFLWGDHIVAPLLYFSIILLGAALMTFIIAKRLSKEAQKTRNQYRIPNGQITYSDLNRPARPLFSRRYRLTGKPDYIVRTTNGYIPVEIKSGGYANPQNNHIMQLAAYCQLIEEQFSSFVPHGVLVYNNQDYKIQFDPKLRFDLETVIKQMRKSLETKKPSVNHNDSAKCITCSMKSYCLDKLI